MGEQQRQLQRTAIGHGYEPIGQLRGLASEDLYIGLPIGGAWAGRSGAIGHSLGTCCGVLDTGPGMGSGSGVGMAIDCGVLAPSMGNGMAIDWGVLVPRMGTGMATGCGLRANGCGATDAKCFGGLASY